MRALSETFTRRGGCRAVVVLASMFAVMGSARILLAQDLPPGQSDYSPRAIEKLRQLVGPIALYPDALLAQVLTASTYPDDVIAAARWEDAGNNPAAADSQPWDSSVKGVARYPSVMHYLASNGDWMNDLGDAFLNQQGDVMSAVQELRGDALAAGTLSSTPQQTVINQDGYIQIIPADPQYLYAPVYDPRVVYAPPPLVVGEAYPAYVTFGPRVEVGEWLDCDLDWHDRAVYFGRWGRDRPWWNERDRKERYHYLDDRPGIYRPGEFKDDRGRPIEVQSSHWQRDDHRPPPRRVDRPAAQPSVERPERGYPQRASGPSDRPAETPRGADVSRQSERGRTSRERAAQPAGRPSPAPAPRAPAPARHAPAPAEHAPPQHAPAPPQHAPAPAQHAPVPRQPAPPPEARPSAPTRGGAMGGYQNGPAASHGAARGSGSRGKR